MADFPFQLSRSSKLYSSTINYGIEGVNNSGSSDVAEYPYHSVANSNSAWYQLVGKNDLPFSAYSMMMNMQTVNGGSAQTFLVDIGMGDPGSEVILAQDILLGETSQYQMTSLLPLYIPKGKRVAMRFQTQDTTTTIGMRHQTLFMSSPSMGFYGKQIDALGSTPADSGGTQVDPGGSANTKGSYVELESSTTHDYCALMLIVHNPNASLLTDATWLFDVAVGAAASEVDVISNMYFKNDFTFYGNPAPQYGFIPLSVPAGSRISVRCQCSITTVGDRELDAIVYGLKK